MEYTHYSPKRRVLTQGKSINTPFGKNTKPYKSTFHQKTRFGTGKSIKKLISQHFRLEGGCNSFCPCLFPPTLFAFGLLNFRLPPTSFVSVVCLASLLGSCDFQLVTLSYPFGLSGFGFG